MIARVHGVATAAGCQLVATCDLAVAADERPLRNAGRQYRPLLLDADGRLSRAVGRKAAMEMLLTGELIERRPGARARARQPRRAANAELDDAVDGLAEQIAGKCPLTLAIGKEAFYRQAELPLDEAYGYACAVMTDNMLARDAEEGIDAFLEKRAPVWTGK